MAIVCLVVCLVSLVDRNFLEVIIEYWFWGRDVLGEVIYRVIIISIVYIGFRIKYYIR